MVRGISDSAVGIERKGFVDSVDETLVQNDVPLGADSLKNTPRVLRFLRG